MNLTPTWHQQSYTRFMQETLPALLAQRIPLAGYQTSATGAHTWQVTIAVSTTAAEPVEATYIDLPAPDAAGLFYIDNTIRTVVPVASHSDLESATIKCVGDMLFDFVEARLGQAAPDLPWDQALLRAWLPLDRWFAEFMETSIYAQVLDQTNWLAGHIHPRRLIIEHPTKLTTPGQFGRVCPFEMPEGPNLGRIFSIARGATIRNGRLDMVEETPTAALGLSASMIPCLEHDDPNRLLMGANMMRQWLPFAEPEPALVQTGHEPAAAEFWGGRNLLTAFLPWGGDTYEDGIVLSQSAAQRLSNPHQGQAWYGNTYRITEPGDKLSNRHGEKGVVSRILPDAQMPRRADGAPVELIFTSASLPNRLNVGQLVELLLGRIAQAEGAAVVASPFACPSEAEIRQRLAALGQPEDGLETLYLPAEKGGESGEPLACPSAVGYLYWGVTNHLVRDKCRATADDAEYRQRQAEMEYQVLKEAGAIETIREQYNTRAAGHHHELAAQVAAGAVTQADSPAPRFALLRHRLAAAGIDAALQNGRLHFTLEPPTHHALKLARAVQHPWLPEETLATVAPFPAAPELPPLWADPQQREAPTKLEGAPMVAYQTVAALNSKLQRLVDGHGPQSLLDSLHSQLQNAVAEYLNELVTVDDLRFDSRVCFSGRSVVAPGPQLHYDQVGLPNEMAWTLFGPLVQRELGDAAAVAQQTEVATHKLDAIMARSWIIVNRAPSVTPETMLAFHPVRIADRAVRLHPLACPLLNTDFDGDQVAVFLPITAAGQREAGAQLSLAGHLTRNPKLVEQIAPRQEAMWGLAWLSLEAEGLQQIEAIMDRPLSAPDGFVTRATLVDALAQRLATEGVQPVLETLTALFTRGFAAIQKSGFAMSAFTEAGFAWPVSSSALGVEQVKTQYDQYVEKLLAITDYTRGLGPYVLAVRSGALPDTRIRVFPHIAGLPRVRTDVNGQLVIVERGFRQGLTLADFYALAPAAREGLAYVSKQWDAPVQFEPSHNGSRSFHVLARARRAAHPGIVFARAAAIGEIEPLVDEDSRLFVGV